MWLRSGRPITQILYCVVSPEPMSLIIWRKLEHVIGHCVIDIHYNVQCMCQVQLCFHHYISENLNKIKLWLVTVKPPYTLICNLKQVAVSEKILVILVVETEFFLVQVKWCRASQSFVILLQRSSEEFRDPVSRSQILRLSKEVSCWDFMLMRAAGQCTGKLGKSFYSELLKEFKTLLVNMRRLSGSLLCEIPESSGLDDGEEDNGIVRISEILSSSLGQRIGSFKVETPSQENLPRR